MPFPWKKNRVTRISQIVADLQSPKHGGSLVVETGFPTSLIDLFVKNRSRFKKSKSKKPFPLEIPDLPPPPPSPATSPPLPETPNFSVAVVACAEPRLAEAPSLRRLAGENAHTDDVVAGSGREVDRVGECPCGSGANMFVAVFLKMFVVVVLISSVKKLTVGITISAFALLFLEYAGKRVVSCLRPCSNANMALVSLAQRVGACNCFQKLPLKMKKNCEVSKPVVEFVAGAELSSNSSSIEEIEVVGTKSDVGICCETTNFAGPELHSEMQEGSKGKVVEQIEVPEGKARGSRSGKFKSKIVKKLVPKKFRCSKKEKKEKRSKESEAESGSEVSTTNMEEDKSPSFEIQEEQENVGKSEEDNRNRSALLLKTKLVCIRDNEAEYGITCSQESQLERMDRVRNPGYIILFVITLAGLVIGRFPALVLTLTWCFMSNIVKTRGRSQIVPLIKCSIPNS